MKQTKRLTAWSDITLEQYIQMINVGKQELDELENLLELVKIVCGEEVEQLPLAEYKQMINHINFLSTPIPDVKPKSKYIIGGKEYVCDLDLSKITGSQYIDYSTYIKQNDGVDGYPNLLSVFLVPKGCKYNDGTYDINELKMNVPNMLFVDVKAIAFFLQRQYKTLLIITVDYSISVMKKMMKKETDPQKKIEIQKKIDELQTHLRSMV